MNETANLTSDGSNLVLMVIDTKAGNESRIRQGLRLYQCGWILRFRLEAAATRISALNQLTEICHHAVVVFFPLYLLWFISPYLDRPGFLIRTLCTPTLLSQSRTFFLSPCYLLLLLVPLLFIFAGTVAGFRSRYRYRSVGEILLL